ncbi:MAG: DUF4231 domain-containing protein [Ilumatobacter sp.]|uniref:DUF4231 domain-containing protein n=1 Tax=Ilumatobacter sp. TaxID=1967498 RepID=UPI002629719C|nr:DUF4231 domain-containing protein [Ilumatobacter sp.]MDJ0770577.1 DUF4231 domain-containing protein [Ilumatobacter sp.]
MSNAAESDKLRASIDALGLTPDMTTHLKDRWLDQLLWFERKAASNQTNHRWLRMVALIGGVALPLIVNLSTDDAETWIQAVAVGVSLVVGVAVATESFLRPGEKWLQYRQTAELLRSEWWMFVSRSGDYAGFDTLGSAHPRFVERVEWIINEDVAGFMAIMAPSVAGTTTATQPATGDSPASDGADGS